MVKDCPERRWRRADKGSVTEQLLATRPDVTMGGGAETFAQTATGGDYAGKTLEVQAKERGYQIVRTANELANVTQGRPGRAAARPVRRRQHAGAVDRARRGAAGLPAARGQVHRQPRARRGGAEIGRHDAEGHRPARPAAQKGKDKGFFLQVESASIDKRDHAADPCGQIGETVVFDEAVQKALEFAKKDGNTLVIATADHGHTSQIVETVTEDDLRGIAEDTKLPIERVRDIMYPGLTRKLTTADDAEMTVSYGTSGDVDVEDQTHTGTQVRHRGVRSARGERRRPDRSDRPVLHDDRRTGDQAVSVVSAGPQRAGEDDVDLPHRDAVGPPRDPLEQVQRADVGRGVDQVAVRATPRRILSATCSGETACPLNRSIHLLHVAGRRGPRLRSEPSAPAGFSPRPAPPPKPRCGAGPGRSAAPRDSPRRPYLLAL